MSKAIYPGSFDPITLGHLSLIRAGLVVFDELVVAVLHNPKKNTLFTVEERVEMMRDAIAEYKGIDETKVKVESFDGLLVDYAERLNIHAILRGLRAVADFEYELQMANMNRHLDNSMETVFIMAQDDFFYVSSNLVKEAAMLGANVKGLVPPNVLKELRAKVKTS